MEGQKINEIPVGGNLADTDSILSVNSGGGLKRVSGRDVASWDVTKGLITTDGWVRLVRLTDRCGGIVFLTTTWSNTMPRVYMFAFGFPGSIGGAAANTMIQPLFSNGAIFTKLRLVYKSGNNPVHDCYIEAYKTAETEKIVIVQMPRMYGATPCVEPGSIPEGYVSKEVSLAEAKSGGGDLFPFRFAERRVA